MRILAYPRVGQAGLGNSLFPWARAEIFGNEVGVPLLAPRWARVRLGPYLRREPDKRRYGGYFRSAAHVRGAARLLLLLTSRRVAEAEREEARSLGASSMRPCIVEFEGISGLFEPLVPRARFVRDRLWEMTSPRLRPAVAAGAVPFIAMHVRRGDLTRQGFTAVELDGVLQYTPLSWFLHGVHEVRRADGLRHLPILIFTDGDDGEVGALLACDGVYRAEPRSAITDLWSMSNAVLLFASGFSTFGMWASFLGGMPTLYAPGKIQQPVQRSGETGVELETSEGEPIPESVRAMAVKRLDARG